MEAKYLNLHAVFTAYAHFKDGYYYGLLLFTMIAVGSSNNKRIFKLRLYVLKLEN